MATMGPHLHCLLRCLHCAALLSVHDLTLDEDGVELVVVMAFVTLSLAQDLLCDHIREAPQTGPQKCEGANERETPHDALRHGVNEGPSTSSTDLSQTSYI